MLPSSYTDYPKQHAALPSMFQLKQQDAQLAGSGQVRFIQSTGLKNLPGLLKALTWRAASRFHPTLTCLAAACRAARNVVTCATDGGVDVHTGGCQVAGGCGGAVHLVLSVQGEHDVQRPHQLGVGPVPAKHTALSSAAVESSMANRAA